MPSGESSSGSAKSDPPTVDPNAFEKEMMGLTGGFPGGEVGLKDFVAKNPPPPPKRAQTDGKASSAVVPAGPPRPPELALFVPGMVVLVSLPTKSPPPPLPPPMLGASDDLRRHQYAPELPTGFGEGCAGASPAALGAVCGDEMASEYLVLLTHRKHLCGQDGISREIKALPLCFAIYTDKPEVACVEHSGVGHTRNPGAPDLITRWVAKREQPISGEPQHRTGWHLNRRLLTVGAALGVPNDSLFRDLVELDGKEMKPPAAVARTGGNAMGVKLEARQSRKKAGHRPNSVMRTGTVG
ncbi:hypothetical protein ZWY2020_005927 [Hordeum vulgare]|nr:hypothetical protein ZWY2020_005927 [Hordeum vulgare]